MVLQQFKMLLFSQTNSKASIASELESLKHKVEQSESNSKTSELEVQGLREAVAERDRSIAQLREQIKYYINFAENSIHGHLDGKRRNTSADHEQQVEQLVKDLQEAKVCVCSQYRQL